MAWADAGPSGDAYALLGAVDPNVILDALMAALEAGWMVALSASRDGGALSISTTADGTRERCWVTDAAELDRTLTALTGAAKASR